MAAPYDLVIRDGMLVDGLGGAPYRGDVALKHGKIAALGASLARGVDEIDARGKWVTPGFVDIHTHYDGHATWANRLAPSSDHGVTTVVMGNCGVGFAPCAPADQARLIRLMEGVEDIPDAVMSAGLPWNWESFPDYLNSLEARQFDMDVAAYLPHAPLRVHVMGARAAAREPATEADARQMRRLAREAVDAGAMGFSTSRSLNHKASDGVLTPTYAAGSAELVEIAKGLKDAGRGVLQIISDFDEIDAEFALIRAMVQESGRPLSLSLLQFPHVPDRWRQVLDRVNKATQQGLPIKAQIAARPIGVMSGLRLSRNAFMRTMAYREVAHLNHGDRIQALRDRQRRTRVLAEMPGEMGAVERHVLLNLAGTYELDADGYEPAADRSIASRAARAGQEPAAFLYDLMISGNGDTRFYFPAANFADNNVRAIEAMLDDKDTILGLGDGGAHCGLICDASLPTYMIQRWSNLGSGAIPIERVIRRLTSETAGAVGLCDRGVLASGYRADLNIIDGSRIALRMPQTVKDLPDGGERLDQKADGYVATIVNGQITYREGAATGALPGRLVRGQQSVS